MSDSVVDLEACAFRAILHVDASSVLLLWPC